jgi:hypothetical protein
MKKRLNAILRLVPVVGIQQTTVPYTEKAKITTQKKILEMR